MASAVSGWSPVIITGRMPAVRQVATASRTSARGGSMMPTSPSSVMSSSATGCVAGPAHRAVGDTEHAHAVRRHRIVRRRHTGLPLVGQPDRALVVPDVRGVREQAVDRALHERDGSVLRQPGQ